MRVSGLNEPFMGTIVPNMGIKSSLNTPDRSLPRRSGVADALFTRTQQRLLALLFGHPERSFYANELITLAGAGSGAVQRELARLTQGGLLTVRPVGNQKHYQANPDSPIHAELCAIARKTVGLAAPLRAALASVSKRISAAFVFGSVAKREDAAGSDIDLMLVSDDLGYGDLYAALEEASGQLGRRVNPTIYSSAELAKRIERGDAFVTRVLAQPKIWLLGDEHALGI